MTGKPWLWLVAGPNGSGKSTIMALDAVRVLLGAAQHLDPDREARRIQEAALGLGYTDATWRRRGGPSDGCAT